MNKYRVTPYQRSILNAVEDKLIEVFDLNSTTLRDLIRAQRDGETYFSFPELIYGIDALIILCERIKYHLIDLKQWLKKNWIYDQSREDEQE